MKTHWSNNECAKKQSQLQAKQILMFPPTIMCERGKVTDDNEDTKDKDKCCSFDIQIDEDDTVEFHVKVCEGGTPEECCLWLKEHHNLLGATGLNCLDKVNQQVNIICTPLKGESLTAFNTQLANEVGLATVENTVPQPTQANIDNAIKKLTLKAFDNDQNAHQRQVHHMRYHLHFLKHIFTKFIERLKQMNGCLLHFPMPTGRNAVESFRMTNSWKLSIGQSQSSVSRCYCRTTATLVVIAWKSTSYALRI